MAAAALLASTLAVARAQAKRQGPLVLAKSSYFFVGGKLDPAVEGTAPVGHIYVEYMIPQRLRHRTPFVIVHCVSQSGTNFTGTPDGREGWAQYCAAATRSTSSTASDAAAPRTGRTCTAR
jgi:hypothetical protein